VRIRLRPAALAVAVFAAAGACRAPQEPSLAGTEIVADLVRELPVAEVRQELSGIDFGTPEARPFLGAGFYADEGSRDDSRVWSRGPSSEVELFLAAPRELRAEIVAASWRDFPRLRVTPSLNGHPLSPFELTPAPRTLTLELPATALLPGANRLRFSYSQVSEPRRDTGHRRLSAAWYELRLRPNRPIDGEPRIEALARPDAPPDAISLPLGSEAAYYLDLPAGSSLVVDRVAAEKGAAKLAVIFREEGGRERSAGTLEPSRRRQVVRLPQSRAGLVRLALRPLPEPGSPREGRIRLDRPAIRAAAGAPRPRAAAASAVPPPARHPDVLVYLVDTLRADRLGCYGYPKPVSPHLDRFARGAVLFEDAIAQAPWTRPAVATLMTGLPPTSHGVQTLDDRLPAAALTLPEILRQAGYRTAAISTNYHVSPQTGLDQGFDDFVMTPEEPASAGLTRRALAWLDARPDRRPFFLYVHALDPHAPYRPPLPLRRRFAPAARPEAGTKEDLDRLYRARGPERAARIAEIAALYDAEIAANDDSFGRLLEGLETRGLLDGTLVVFLADHGEELGERGNLGHGHSLYQELLRIPLVIKPAGRKLAGRRSAEPAQQIDLLPTVLAAAGLPPQPAAPGLDLLSRDRGPRDAGRAALSHLRYDGISGMSAIASGWKLVLPFSRKLAEGPELYDLAADPGETRNRAADDPVRAGYLATLVRAERRRGEQGLPAESAVMGEEARKALHALGY
jgi:choline-sulfatase